MIGVVRIEEIDRSTLNEYEGTLRILWNALESIWTRVLLPHDRAWDELAIGTTVSADVYLLRFGPVTELGSCPHPALLRVQGDSYSLSGRVVEVHGEQLLVDAGTRVHVDLDSAAAQSTIRLGSLVELSGVMQLDFFPDDDASQMPWNAHEHAPRLRPFRRA